MITSRLTAKARTTIPQSVREALHLKEGDEIAYAIGSDRVVLTRLRKEGDKSFATFSEWEGEADCKAYAGLAY